MHVAKKIVTFIDSISNWTGKILGWIIVPLVLLVVMEVVLRYFFDSPTIWSFEVSKQLYAVHFMILAAFGLMTKAHVSVDVVTLYLSNKTRAVIDIISYLIFFFPFCIITAWKGYVFAAKSWAVREVSWSVWQAPLYPIKTVVTITFILLFIQGVSEFIKRVMILKGVEI